MRYGERGELPGNGYNLITGPSDVEGYVSERAGLSGEMILLLALLSVDAVLVTGAYCTVEIAGYAGEIADLGCGIGINLGILFGDFEVVEVVEVPMTILSTAPSVTTGMWESSPCQKVIRMPV